MGHGLGRTAMTYRQRLETEVERWASFRRALLKEEKETFERLVDNSFRYVHAGSMYPSRDTFDIFLISSLLSHEERLWILEKEMRRLMRKNSFSRFKRLSEFYAEDIE